MGDAFLHLIPHAMMASQGGGDDSGHGHSHGHSHGDGEGRFKSGTSFLKSFRDLNFRLGIKTADNNILSLVF